MRDRLAEIARNNKSDQFALIPYRGSAPALQDIVAGQLDLSFDFWTTVLPFLRAGDIKAPEKKIEEDASGVTSPRPRCDWCNGSRIYRA